MKKNSNRLRTGLRIALIAGVIAVPFLPSIAHDVHDALPAKLFFPSAVQHTSDTETFEFVIRTNTLQPTETSFKTSTLSIGASSPVSEEAPLTFMRKVVPVSTTQLFPVSSSSAASSVFSTQPLVLHTAIQPSSTMTNASSYSSSGFSGIGIPSISTFLQQWFSPIWATSSSSSSSVATTSSSSSSVSTTSSSVATTSSSSTWWTTSSSVATTTSSSSSTWWTTSSSVATTTSSSTTSSSVSSVTLHNAASSSSPATCNIAYTEGNAPAGSCCDGTDNNYNGVIDTLDPACTSVTTSSSVSSMSSVRCDPTRSGDDDGDGLVNAIDPDCH